MIPSVFLGLVTHQGTRFSEASSSTGLVHQICETLSSLGIANSATIHASDLFETVAFPLTQSEVLASIDAELDLESRWRRYVDSKDSGIRVSAEMRIRRTYRRLKLAPPWHRDRSATPSGSAMLRRLINIELAHLALLREARASGATWALIAEDDARLDDAYIFAKDLVQFITEVSPDSQPKYVNLSRSFTHDTLRLDHRLTEVGRWDAKTAVLAADKPLTNTVCSILYRVSFLDTLVPTLDSIPISPVLPIDWKLNQALLLLHSSKALGEGDCWFLDPGPIVQGSMA